MVDRPTRNVRSTRALIGQSSSSCMREHDCNSIRVVVDPDHGVGEETCLLWLRSLSFSAINAVIKVAKWNEYASRDWS